MAIIPYPNNYDDSFMNTFKKMIDTVNDRGEELLSNEAVQETMSIWLTNNTFKPKESVSTYANLPSTAQNNELRGVMDENAVYVYNGENWVKQSNLDYAVYTDLKKELEESRGVYEGIPERLNAFDERLNGMRINALHPPAPLNAVVPDADYYDEVNFKYYSDETMTVPATDNRGAVQGMVDYLNQNGGGVIEMPTGKFAFRSRVNWESKVSLVGASKTLTHLYAEGEQFSLIQGTNGALSGSDYADESVWLEDCNFRDFLIDNKGLSYPSETAGGKGLFLLYMKNSSFRDLILMNTLGTALGCDFLVNTNIDRVFTDRAGRSSYPTGYGGNSGIGIGTSALTEEPVIVSNCFTYNSGNYGVFVETQINPEGKQARFAKVVNCHSQGNKLGFGNKGSGGTQYIGCTAFKNRSHGFHFTQESSGDQVLACFAEYNGGDGVRVEADYKGDIQIHDIVASYNNGSGVEVKNNIVGGLNNVSIKNVRAHYNGYDAVWVHGNVSNLEVHFVNAKNNGQDTSINTTLRQGIRIEGIIDIASIIGNTAIDDQDVKTQTAGYRIGTNVTNYIFEGNNAIGYEGNDGYQINSNDGIIGANGGLIREVSGTATFSDGEKAIYINHYLGKPPVKVLVMPMGDDTVWINSNTETNRTRIERGSSTGTLDVTYYLAL